MKIIKTMKELGTAIDAGAAIEFKRAVVDEWMPRNIVAWPFNDIVRAVSDGRCRLTQKMTFIQGPGGRFEYPEPVDKLSDVGEEYWFVNLLNHQVNSTGNNPKYDDLMLSKFRHREMHLTEDAADQHLSAYRQAMEVY